MIMKKTSKLGQLCLITFVSFLLVSCSSSAVQETPTLASVPPIISTTTPEKNLQRQETKTVATAMPPESTDKNTPVIPDYNLQVKFDYSNQSLLVNETIVYVNNSNHKLPDIRLANDTFRYPGSFSLENITINGSSEVTVEEGKYFFTITLKDALKPAEEIEIKINYRLSIPPLPPPADDRKPGIFGYSTVQTNLVDWYPFIPPLTETGEWLLHDPWFYGEYLVYDLANFQVEIDLLNVPANAIIAASTIPVSQENNRFVYNSTKARNFVWSLSPSYVVGVNELNGNSITTHTFPFHQQAGEHVLGEVTKAIELYSKLFSPYPRNNLTIVEADFLDGMEYDGLFFLSRGFYNLFDYTPQNYLTTIAVHETAHQWWYAAVANDQAMEPWLDEALCTYSELLFYEEYYPELVNWWWEYRVNYYQPEGTINQTIYEYQGFVPYRNATYLQGAKFLQSLREELGDEDFFEFLNEYATSQNNKISTQAHFFNLLEKYTDQDIANSSPYFIKSNK